MSKLNNTGGRRDGGRKMAAQAALALAATLAVGHLVEGAAPAAGVGGSIQVDKVVRGSAQFNFSGNNALIKTGTDRTIINYKQFNVLSGQSVNFAQPSTGSRVLNRINANDPSRINGSIRSNGILYFVNPAGIIFGPNSVINVGQIYAAAGTISDSDFLNGRNRFTNLRGPVINGGVIQANAVHLAGQSVVNLGTIIGGNGAVTMTAGDDVLIGQERDGAEAGHLFVKIEGAAAAAKAAAAAPTEAAVQNAGTIMASQVHLGAGDLFSIAVRSSGKIKAQEVTVQGGKGSTVGVAGTIDASNKDGKGGTVAVLGDRVALQGAKIDASGTTGGGTVLVGGDFQGKGTTPTARETLVDKGSTIKADATVNGDGGKVVVWSDQITGFAGKIDAKGGAAGGNGGNVEVSGKQKLIYQGTVDVSAPQGTAGTVLMDPASITIVAGPAANADINGDATLGDDITALTDLDNAATKFPGAASIITTDGVNGLLTGNSTLILAATTNIDVNAAVTGAGNANLTLNTATVNLNAGITLAGSGVLSGTPTTVNVLSGGMIRNGISLVSSGGTVNVAAGTYNENIAISKALVLSGAGAASTTIQGTGGAGPVVTINYAGTSVADGVHISGFTIKPAVAGVAAGDWPVQVLDGSKYVWIEGNTIDTTAAPSQGISFTGTYDHITIGKDGGGTGSGNTFLFDDTGGDVAIDFNPESTAAVASNVYIRGNTFTESGTVHNAMKFGNVTNLTITGNPDIGSNIVLEVGNAVDSDGVSITGNTFTSNGINDLAGIGVLVVSNGANALKNLTIQQNEFDTRYRGIAFYAPGGGDPQSLVDANLDATTLHINNNYFHGCGKALSVGSDLTIAFDAANNAWGSDNGPANAANTFNVSSQGDVVTNNGGTATINFAPWWQGVAGSAGLLTGTSFAPVTLGAGKYSNIQAAIDAGISGDTINLAAGTYTEVFDNSGKILTLAFGGSGGFSNGSGLTLGADLAITGSGATALTLAQAVDANGFHFTMDTTAGTGAVNVNSVITYQNQALALKAGGLLSFGATGGIAGAGNGDATLVGVGFSQNAAASIDAGAGKISIDGGAGAVTTGPLTTTSNDVQAIRIFNASDIHVNGTMSAVNGTADLTVGAGALDQTAQIVANALRISAGGTVTLNHGSNAMGTLTITAVGGAVQFTDAANLTVGGIAANGFDVTLTAGAGGPWTLGQSGIIDTGANKLTLDKWGDTTLNSVNTVAILSVTNGAGFVQFTDASNLDVQGISAATKVVTLTASGAGQTLGQTAGIINVGELDLASWDVTTLNRQNTVGVLNVTGGTGSVAFTNAANLSVAGIDVGNNDVTLTAGAGGPWTLGQTALINTGTNQLTLDKWGNTTLNSANTVPTLAVTNGVGTLQFTNAADLSLAGIDVGSHNATLTAGGAGGWILGQTVLINTGANKLTLDGWGDTTLNSDNTVGALAVTNGAGFLQFTNAAALSVAGIDVGSHDVTLTAGAGGPWTLGQSALINTGTNQLTLDQWGNTTLNSGNTVPTLVVTNGAGTVQFTNAGDLMVGGIAANGFDVTLTAGAGGPWTLGQSGIIDTGANKLTLDKWGDTTLNSVNTVAILSVTNGVGLVQFTDAGNLDVQGISAATKVVTLTASGAGQTLGQTAGIINVGELDLASWDVTTLNRQNTVGVLNVTGGTGNVAFTNAANLDVQGIGAAGQLVTLTAGAGGPWTLGESAGIINAAELDLASWGTTALNQANTIPVLKVTGGTGSIGFTTAGNLDVQGIDVGSHDATLTAGGAGGWTLGQTAGIINTGSGKLTLDQWGDTTLNNANTVGALAVTNGAGTLQFTNAANLSVAGIDVGSHDVTLTAGAGGPWTLGQSALINTGTNQLTLDGWGNTTLNSGNTVAVLLVSNAVGIVQFANAASLDVQGINAPGQTVTLTASGANRTLTQTVGIINAGELRFSGWFTTALNAANTVNILKITSTTGTVGFTNVGNLDVQGISASGHDVTLTAGAGGPWTLGQTAGIINTGIARLTLDGWGDTTLNNANTVAILSVTNGAGFVKFTNAANLDVQGIDPVAKVVTLTASGANRTLSQTAGIIDGAELDLASWGTTTLNGANTVGVLKVMGGTGNIGFTNAGNLDVQGIGASGHNVTLTAGGAGGWTLGQTAGIINTGSGKLTLDGWGDTTLNNANTVGALAVTNGAGTLQFTNAANLSVAGIDVGSHDVTLTAGGAGGWTLGQTALINTGTNQLTLDQWGATTLNNANTVSKLLVSNGAGTVGFTNAGDLDVQGIAASGFDVTLTAGAGGPWTLDQTAGVINTGVNQLTLDQWGDTTLNSANTVASLLVTNGVGFVQFTNASSLDVQGIAAPTKVVTLTASGANRMVGQSVGIINAGELDLSSWQTTILNQPNTVGILEVTGAAGPVGFTNAANLDVQGIGATGYKVTLTANGAGRTLTQTAGIINAGELDLNGWFTTTLNRANSAVILNVTGATGAVGFTNANSLNVTGIGAAGQDVTLTSGAGGPWMLQQTAGIINTGSGKLTLDQWDATILDNANTVAKLAVTNGVGAVQFTNAANLDVQGIAAAGQTVTLTASGASRTLSQTAGIINAAELDLASWNTTTLNRANTGGILKVTGAAGSVAFTNAANLDVQGIAAAGQTVTLTASGANRTLGQTVGIITAGELDLASWGTTTLTRSNAVGVLQVTGGTGVVQFTNGAGFQVNGVDSGDNDITLIAQTGNLIQGTGAVNAGAGTATLTASAANGSILDGSNDNLADVVGATVVLNAGNMGTGSGGIGTGANGAIDTTAGSLVLRGGSGGIFVHDTDSPTLTTLVTNGGALSVIADNTLTLGAFNINTGAGSVTLQSLNGPLSTNGTITTTSGSIMLSSTDLLTVGHNLTTTSGPISLSGGGFMQSGGTVNAGNSTITVDGGGDDVTTGAMTTTNSTSQAISVGNAAALHVNGVMSATNGTVALTTDSGGLDQTAAIHANTLNVASDGIVTLTNAGNAVGTIFGSSNGAFQFTNSVGFTVDNIDSSDGNITLTALIGNIIQGSGAVDAGAGTATLTASAANGSILDGSNDDVADVIGATVVLNAGNMGTGSGGIGQSAGNGSIDTTATSLVLHGGSGGIFIHDTDSPTLTGLVTNGGTLSIIADNTLGLGAVPISTGSVQLKSLNGPLATGDSITATSGNVELYSSGAMTINHAITSSSGAIAAVSGGQMTVAAALSAGGTVDLSGSGMSLGADIASGDNSTFDAGGAGITLTHDVNVSTTAGGTIWFKDMLDGGVNLIVTTSGPGDVKFDGKVGSVQPLASLTTTAGGKAIFGGGNVGGSTVATTGNQTYGNPIELTADSSFTGATLTFGPVAGGSHDLTLASAVRTNLNGAVTANKLNTPTAGDTVVAGDITTAKGLDWTRPVTIGGASPVTMMVTDAQKSVNFASTLAQSQSLTVDAYDVQFTGAVNASSAAGLTVEAGNNIRFAGTIGGPLSVDLHAYDIMLEGAVGSAATPAGSLAARARHAISVMDVHVSNALSLQAALDQTQDDPTSNAVIQLLGNLESQGGAVNLNAAGRTYVPTVATIVANAPGGTTSITAATSLNVGPNEKITAPGGSLAITADSATFGDLTAMQDITVTANSITVWTRDASGLAMLAPQDTAHQTLAQPVPMDKGTDIVAGGVINFSVVPVTGTSTQYANLTGEPGGALSSVSANFHKLPIATVADFGDLLLWHAQRNNAAVDVVLDYRSDGPPNIDIANTIAGATPRAMPKVEQESGLSGALKDELRRMGVSARDWDMAQLISSFTSPPRMFVEEGQLISGPEDRVQVTADRLAQESARSAAGAFFDAYYEVSADPAKGTDVPDPRTGRIKHVEDARSHIQHDLAEAVNAYAKTDAYKKSGKFNAADFMNFVNSSPEQQAARDRIAKLRLVFQKVGSLGLTDRELKQSHDALLSGIVPEGDVMDADQLLSVLTAPMQTASR